MNNITISSFLKTCDWIPVVSTATNLFHLYARSWFTIDATSDYGQYLNQRTIIGHGALAIPLLNIINLIYNFNKKVDLRADLLESTVDYKFFWYLGQCGLDFGNDPEIVKAAVTQNGTALKYASDRLKSNSGICLQASRQTHKANKFVPPGMKNLGQVLIGGKTTDPRAHLALTLAQFSGFIA
jgi:hypothetical protein